MKKTVLILLALFIFSACKNEEKNNELNVGGDEIENSSESESEIKMDDDSENTIYNNDDSSDEENEIIEDMDEYGETPETNTSSEGNESNEGIPVLGFSGNFQKKADAYSDCNCNCLMIQLNSTERVCLDKESNIYLTVNYKKTGDHQASMYLVNGRGNLEDTNPIPWGKFDKNLPIATINSLGKQLKVDWIGFKMNGELANDYAILGKKTVEGYYVLK